MTEYDCEIMPRLHHIRIIGERLLNFYIPRQFTHLWAYILTAYRTAAFIESCPADQDILHHYKVYLLKISKPCEHAFIGKKRGEKKGAVIANFTLKF